MDELKSAREETERTRKDVGAIDLRPGEVEGMGEDKDGEGEGRGGPAVGKSRALEKRKRELEERRRMIDAKRRKVKGHGVGEEDQFATSTPIFEAGEEKFEAAVQNFEAGPAWTSAPALEALAHSVIKKGKGKQKVASDPQHAADDFLAQLEREMLGSSSTGKGK